MSEITYKVIKDTEEMLKTLAGFDKTKPLFCDTEGETLYANPRIVQAYQKDGIPYLFDFDYCDYNIFRESFRDFHTVWHNASYDFGTLNLTTREFDDTMYLVRMAYPKLPKHPSYTSKYGLDNVVHYLVNEKLYDGLDKSNLQKAGFIRGARLSKSQLQYSAVDVIALSELWELPKVQQAREILAYKVDILSLKYCVDYQQNGLVIDQDKVIEELDKLEHILIDEYKKLEDVANKLGLNCGKSKYLNTNSPKQIKEAFSKVLGSEPASTDKRFLIGQVTGGGKGAELADLVLSNRANRKLESFLSAYNRPKVFTKYNPAGATTGRFTSCGKGAVPDGVNAQQIPRKLQYLMNTDTKDTVVVHADYSTAELRAGCSIMGDEAMYRELMVGRDLHKVSAMLADTSLKYENVTKEDRQKGKAISFGFIFGMSAKTFSEYAYESYGVKFTDEESLAIKTRYQKKYPSIAKYASNKWNTYKDTPNRTPQGHIAMAKLGTDAINYSTQGCIAETVKLAIHYLLRVEGGIAIKYIYNVVHDAIYLRVPKGSERFWAGELVKAMKKAWVETCKLNMLKYKDIPMPVEVEYNDYSYLKCCDCDDITNKYSWEFDTIGSEVVGICPACGSNTLATETSKYVCKEI